MEIRPERPGDAARVHALNRAAFESDTEATLVDALRARAAGTISLVAEEDGEIVGHIMFSPVQLTGAPDVRALALAPMAVAPGRQRTGVGSALVRRGLEHSRASSADAVFVVGHPAYYPRFGFTLASGAGIACEFEVPDEAFMVLELVPGVLAQRGGTVVYHEAFREA